MTIPDELVTAAAEAIGEHVIFCPSERSDLRCSCCGKEWRGTHGGLRPWPEANQHVATEALTAAFAKLPEADSSDAPVWYNAEQAGAWAAGWNDAIAALAGMVEP